MVLALIELYKPSQLKLHGSFILYKSFNDQTIMSLNFIIVIYLIKIK